MGLIFEALRCGTINGQSADVVEFEYDKLTKTPKLLVISGSDLHGSTTSEIDVEIDVAWSSQYGAFNLKYKGGLFMIPRYGIGINLREGDLLIANVHEYHCNSEIFTDKEDDDYNNNMANDFSNLNKELYGEEKYSRISFVCYLREKLIECD